MSAQIVRVARDLNRAGLWTIYRKEGGRWKPSEKVASLMLSGVSWVVSRSGLERIRTPKGQKTSTGAKGIGKRTVVAFAVGVLEWASDVQTPHPTTCPTIHFNPFKHDAFMLDNRAPAPEGLTLRFCGEGRVEVVE